MKQQGHVKNDRDIRPTTRSICKLHFNKTLEKTLTLTFESWPRMGSGRGECKKLFGKGACGNVPGPKTRFSIIKKRLRQRSKTKNALFHQKKAPAATLQHQKVIVSGERKAPAATHQNPKTYFFTKKRRNRPKTYQDQTRISSQKKRRLRQRSRTKNYFFADRGLSNYLFNTY